MKICDYVFRFLLYLYYDIYNYTHNNYKDNDF